MSEELESNIIIKDPCIEPYFIGKDKYCYTIFEKINTTEGTSYNAQCGHYSKFDRVLLGLASLKVNKKGEYNSIMDYVNEFKKIQNEIKILLNNNNLNDL